MDLLLKTKEFVTGGVPSYMEAFYRIKWGAEKCHEMCNISRSYHPADFVDALQSHSFVDWKYDPATVLILAILWTVLRYIVATFISKVGKMYNYV